MLLAAGCTTGLGPQAIQSERPDYNRQIIRSSDEQMLLNLVRLRYNDSPLFLELGTVVAQYSFDASLSASDQTANHPIQNNFGVGAGVSYSEHPTITYTPLAGDEYAERMLTPILLESLMLFNQTGWSSERLMLVAVQRINNVVNAPTATGPTPQREPNYEAFRDLAVRLRRLQAAGLFGLDWDMQRTEKVPAGHFSHFWLHMPADASSPLAADVAQVRRLLELEPGRENFQLTAFPFDRQPGEVGLRCRSLLGVLYFLSEAVEPPVPHVQAGLVTVTKDDNGQPFDWSKVTSGILSIHSQLVPPGNAAVAVQHRGWWFYIADDDPNSKATFSLLNILFGLQSASGKGKSPALTLPLGR